MMVVYILGLVFGKYGECSSDVDILLRAMAEQGAVLLHQSMGATSVLDAKSCLLRRFKVMVGITGVRSHAVMRLSQLRTITGQYDSFNRLRDSAQAQFDLWRREYFYQSGWHRRSDRDRRGRGIFFR